VDRVIVGEAETIVQGIAVVWTPTWAALRQALAQGCNVVVAHEPTFFSNHDLDAFETEAREPSASAGRNMKATRQAKRGWIEEQRMVVVRCHDVLDLMPGGVVDSLATALGFGEADYLTSVPYYRVVRLKSAQPAHVVASRLANAFGILGQPGVTFYGDAEREVRSLGLGTGYASEPGRFVELGADMGLTIDDRIKTWIEAEWSDDSGYPLVVIHHGTSEEWGVRRLREIIANRFPAVKVEMLPQGFRAKWIPCTERLLGGVDR
jgi:putative NIF3 family GTP cyclohydrolase 1 type 2